MDQLFGTVERITFQNEENGFTVARVKLPRRKDLATILGTLPPLQPGQKVSCLGSWKNNPTHGQQFEVKECKVEAPNDLIGIEKYLASGLIKGIGPAFAARIVKEFGLETLTVLEKAPERLSKISGIGEKKIESVIASFKAHKAIQNVMLFLQKYGVTPAYAHRIYKVFGEEAIERVEENPYKLAEHIPGIGFKMADKIAEKMGVHKASNFRVDACIEYLLLELSQQGHVCYPKAEFIKLAKDALELDPQQIAVRITALTEEQKLVEECIENVEMVWLKKLFLTEKGIAKEIERLKKNHSPLRQVDVEKAVTWAETIFHIELAEQQKVAVSKSLQEKLHIITGGPGTGKSTITKAILAIHEKLTNKIILAAPTGRAAKRMSEITKNEAFTIHSLLQYNFTEGGFRRNRENPLFCDLIIIDESSMIDTYLMYSLLKAIPDHSRVIFIGDIHQLPSVGPGNVLRDLIASQKLSVTGLTKIFRQAASSKIITNAHKINEGRFPYLSPDENSDFFFIEAKDPQEAQEAIVSLVSTRIPEKYKFDPINEIQVLSPMKKGALGIELLNNLLQQRLNEAQEFIFHHGQKFGVKDKVMQVRNNYDKEVYNGDIGIICEVDVENRELLINFDGKEVPYCQEDLDEITLAYATSIHKYQGSECPCIIIPVHTTHFVMLHRNLLYTAVTRGKKLVILVGTMKAIAIAVGNDEVKKRYTGLKNQLKII